MTADHQPRPRRKWAGLAAFLLATACLLVAFKLWKSALEDAPVDANYRDFLSFVARQTPAAELYLQRYYSRYQRDTVAARHFPQVCSSVTALADQHQVDLRSSPWHTLSDACRRPLTEDEIHILP